MSTSNGPYEVGALVNASVEIKVDGALINPTTIVITVENPADVLTTPTVIHDSLGEYHAIIPITLPGTWKYVWDTTGVAQGSKGAAFAVRTRLVD